MGLQKYILDADPHGLDLLRKRMQMMKARREKNNNPAARFDDSPMTVEEDAVFGAIHARMQQNVRRNNPAITPEEEEKRVNDWLEMLGKKGLVNAFVETPLIMGAPYIGFVINAFICIISYIITGSTAVFVLVAPIVHIIQVVFQRSAGKRQREERLQAILKEGVAPL